MTVQETFLQNLEYEMRKKGVTFYKIAKETNLTNATFSTWKTKNAIPKIDKLITLCQYLDVSANKLLGLPEKEPPDFTAEEIGLIECYRRADDTGKKMIRRICESEGNGNERKLSDTLIG